MQLTNGSRLGPYEIVAPLGAGGMGEVYRAHDTRLHRVVALKILPALSASSDLRMRFEREARAICALTHPNICALYDIGHEDGTDYIVMEYLEGETLAERLARGPLPLSQVLRYGTEIAEALERAHRAGVVHRDLKPGNVMVTSGGAKLLDFGLARRIQPSVLTSSHESSATTEVAPLTAGGAIIGTLHYMSPEQIEGKKVDQRSDIFSLGVLLYEMATGRRPFEGSSRASILVAILSNDPAPMSSLRPDAPPALVRIISVALEKDPERRWQSAHDIAQQLRWIAESNSSSLPSGVGSPRRTWRVTAIIIAITALVAAMASWFAAWRLAGAHNEIETARLDIALPPELSLARSPETGLFAISPDGRALALVASRAGTTSLYVRLLDSVDLRPVEGSDGASAPFWSSDGKWLGFSARGKLWKTRVSGGARPEPICDVAKTGAIASWVGDTILFADRASGGRHSIYRVSSTGGRPIEVMSPNALETESRCSWPQLLPDGRHFLYVSYLTNSPERRLMMGSLDSTQRSVLASDASHGRLAGKDFIVYVREAKLLAQRIDVAKGVTIEDSSTIAENVSWYAITAAADFDVSSNGVLVYATNTNSGRLVVADRRGTERVLDQKHWFSSLAISPDGKRAAVSVWARETGLGDLWIYDLAHGMSTRFTTDPGTETFPFWSPDGRTIVYSSAQGGSPRLALRELSAASGRYLLPEGGYQFGGSFSPDGTSIYYTQPYPGRGLDIYRVPLAAPAHPQRILGTEFNENQPRVSPDGKWLAFTSDSTGDFEIHILNLASGEQIRVTKGGGAAPRWRRDARELFCFSQGAVVSITPGANGDWHDATATPLFPEKEDVEGFDVAPDGQSFLLSLWTPGPTDHLIHVVTDAIPRARIRG